MYNVKLFGKEILSFGKKIFTNINAALRWLETQWDGTDAKVTKANAYPKHVWVYSCVNAIARPIAQVPLKLYQEFNPDKEIVSGPAYSLFQNPSPLLSKYQLWEGEETFKQIRGECFFHSIRGPNFVVEFEFLEPDNMEPVIVDGIIQMWKYHRQSDGLTISIDPADIVHFKYFNPNNMYRGLSPLNAAMLGVEIDDDLRHFDRNLLRNGTYPGSVVQVKNGMNDDERARLKHELKAGNEGLAKAGKIMILEGDAEYKQLKSTPKSFNSWNVKKCQGLKSARFTKFHP